MRSFAFVSLCALLCVSLGSVAGCGKPAPRPRLSVEVSIFPIFDLVRRVAGPDADVRLLLPPGRSEHSYEPSSADVAAAVGTNVGILVGLGLDPWMEKMMTQAAPKARLLTVGDRVPTVPIARVNVTGEPRNDAMAANPDPHVWLDPERARLIVRAVAEELGRADSAHALDYRKRATAIDASLSALDQEIGARLRTLKRRSFVTSHEAFPYFAERYKLDVLGVVVPSSYDGAPGAKPAEAHVRELVELLKATRTACVFGEPQVDSRAAKAIADEANVPLGILDALGGAPETDSYEKLLRFDVSQLEKFLN